MPRYNVESDGEWACFSSVVDAFITPFLPREEYEKWRTLEYGRQCGPIEQANHLSFREALFLISLNRDDAGICHCLREAGLIWPHALESEEDA